MCRLFGPSCKPRSLMLVMLWMEQIIAVVGLVSATTEAAGAGPEQVVGDDGGSPADVAEGGAGSRHGAQNQQGTDAQLLHVWSEHILIIF